VQRIFADYLDGYGIRAIAERLTADGIPCPSAADPARNSHRDGLTWDRGAVKVILGNPRYTGRQVWNRQRKDEVLLDIDNVAQDHTTRLRRNTAEKWVTSKDLSHEPIIDDDTFSRVQDQYRTAKHRTNADRPRRSKYHYQFTGLIYCHYCQRRMLAQHSNGHAYYRCRYASAYARANNIEHPGNVYLREDRLAQPLDMWLRSAFAPANLDATITAMAAAHPIDAADIETARIRLVISRCDAKLATYRQALDTGADPASSPAGSPRPKPIASTPSGSSLRSARPNGSPPPRSRTSLPRSAISSPSSGEPTRSTKPPSTSSSVSSSTTTQTQQRCAPKSTSARTVHQ
jgi:site-specific DNA recombinase